MDPHEWDYLQMNWKDRARARAWNRERAGDGQEVRGIIMLLCLAVAIYVAFF